MPFMEWSDTLSVKNEAIDADHKHLINLINRLHDSMMERQGSKIVGDILNALIDHTKTHFKLEEELMTSTAYTGYSEHKAEHDKLIKQTNELQKKFAEGAPGITLETMDFLRDWLFNHVMTVDQQLGQWITNR